jgi:hypothetical protein
VDVGGAQAGFDNGVSGSSIECEIAREVAAPACIGTEQEACELSELGLAPFQFELDGHLAEFGGIMQRCIHANLACVAGIESEIGANGLAAQLDIPTAGPCG